MFSPLRATLVALVALAAFAPAPARAGLQPTPSPSPDPAEIGRVSTSDRHDEPLDRTTRPTFVVDRAHIEARGDRTVADALTGVPGVQIFRYGAFGAQANLFVRGASSQNVLLLLDGIPIVPGSNGQVDIGSLSTVGIRRIEVVEGGGSTLYGAAAVGGVVNIITDVPRGAYLEVSGGSYGNENVRAAAGDGRFGASFERHVARDAYGYPAVATPGASPIPAGVRTNADAEQSAARISYDAGVGRGLTLRLRAGSDAIHVGVPGSLAFGLTPDARQNVSRDDGRLELAYDRGRASTILTLAGLDQRLGYADPQNPPESDTIDGRTQLSLRHIVAADRTTFVGGVDLVRESAVLTGLYVSGATPSAPPSYVTLGETQAQSAAYVQEQYAGPGGLRAYAGLRGEHDAPLGSVLAPSAGVAVPIAPGLRLAANAGSGFRVPTIIDRFYPGYANPNLKPERSGDGDLTLQSDRILGGASLGYFVRNATNLIQLDANGVPQNVARAALNGFLATVRTRPLHGIVTSLSITDTYRALDLTGGGPAARLPFTPVIAATLALDRPIGAGAFGFGAQANLFGRHVEPGSINNDGQATVDAYVRARIAARCVLALRVRNLGDERYTPILGYPAPGRTFELELATR